MKAELKQRLEELLKEDAEINQAIDEHNKKIDSLLEAETKALKLRQDIHMAKASEFMRELGIKSSGTLLDIVKAVSLND